MRKHLRSAFGEETHRATFFELFFDLVYVFAVTQLAHSLAAHLDLEHAAQTGFLLLVVWWAWMYTTWMTNWFHPEAVAVRSVLIVVMLASLMMSVSIPTAFGDGSLLFGLSYVVLQNVRNAFNVVSVGRSHHYAAPFQRLLAWSLLTTPLWVAGSVADDRLRTILWSGALIIDLAAPLLGYRTPFLGRSVTTDWDIHGGHFAERLQLFIIIALGESIITTGATATDAGISFPVLLALTAAFMITVMLWWLYFHEVAHRSERRMSSTDDPGKLGRNAYTYGHIPIVAGIIVTAVASELVISHPRDSLGWAGALTVTIGPSLYLAGHNIFRYLMARSISGPRALTSAVLLLWIPPAAHITGLLAAVLIGATLLTLIFWELRYSVAPRAAQ